MTTPSTEIINVFDLPEEQAISIMVHDLGMDIFTAKFVFALATGETEGDVENKEQN